MNGLYFLLVMMALGSSITVIVAKYRIFLLHPARYLSNYSLNGIMTSMKSFIALHEDSN